MTKEYILAAGDDLNNITNSGFYRLTTGHLNTPYADTGCKIDYGQMIVAHGGSDTIAQIIIEFSSSIILVRSGNPLIANGTWTKWRRVIYSDNFVYNSSTNTLTINI